MINNHLEIKLIIQKYVFIHYGLLLSSHLPSEYSLQYDEKFSQLALKYLCAQLP